MMPLESTISTAYGCADPSGASIPGEAGLVDARRPGVPTALPLGNADDSQQQLPVPHVDPSVLLESDLLEMRDLLEAHALMKPHAGDVG